MNPAAAHLEHPRAAPWRASLGALALLAVLGGLAFVRARADLSRGRAEALEAVGAWLGLPVEADTVDVAFFPPAVVARRVRVLGDGRGTADVAEVDEARFRVALLPLVRGRVEIDDIRLVAPRLRLVRDANGTWNFSLLHRIGTAVGRPLGIAPSAPSVVVESVRVRDGRISYRDRRIPGVSGLELSDFDLRLRAGSESYRGEFTARGLDGGDENVRGVFAIPRQGSSLQEATIEIRATALDAARFPEIASLLRAQIPFATRLSGQASAEVKVAAPGVWPPSFARLSVVLDTRDAQAELGHATVVKPEGVPLRTAFDLRATGTDLVVDRVAVEVADAALEFVAPNGGPGAAADTQGPLVLAPQEVDVAALARFVPAVERLSPRGRMMVGGRVEPAGDGLRSDLAVVGRDLSIGADGEEWTLGTVALALRTDRPPSATTLDATLAIGSGRSVGGLTLGTLRAVARRSGDGPLHVEGHVENAGRSASRIERIGFEGTVGPSLVELGKVEAAGLGGSLSLRGRAERRADGTWQVSTRPSWSGLDVGSVATLLGGDVPVSGRTSGEARFETAGGTWVESLDRLAGDVDVRVAGGRLPGVNPFRAILASLSDIPGLKEAAERRASEVAPALVGAGSPLLDGDLTGTWRQRRMDVKRLEMRTAEWTLSTRGDVDLDGHTRLAGTLLVASDVSRALLAGPRILAALGPGGEDISIPVRIRGTYPDLRSEPSPEFVRLALARAIGGGGQDHGLGSLLRGILGGGAERAGDRPGVPAGREGAAATAADGSSSPGPTRR